jgi:hypothetical protein
MWRDVLIGLLLAGSLCDGVTAMAQPASADPAAIVQTCVRIVRASPHSPPYPDYANKNFDAYYDRQSNKVFNSARLNVDQEALYIFNKCMTERGFHSARSKRH